MIFVHQFVIKFISLNQQNQRDKFNLFKLHHCLACKIKAMIKVTEK